MAPQNTPESRALDPWLTGKKVPPWAYPELSELHFSRRLVTILVDANVIIRDLKTAARRRQQAREVDAPSPGKTAFFELLAAPHARIFASAADFTLDAQGWTRLERNILQKEQQLGPAMVRLFRQEVFPELWVLDATGLPHTRRSLEVQAADPDDSGLAKLGHLLKPDAFLTYDHAAFGHLTEAVYVLQQAGEHGKLLCAFRDDLRAQELVSFVFIWPLALGSQLLMQGSAALKERGVSFGVQGAAALGVAGLVAGLAWRSPAFRAQLQRLVEVAVQTYHQFQPTQAERSAMQAMMQLTQHDWGAPAAGHAGRLVQVARRLSRAEALSATNLCALDGLGMPAGELSRHLSAWPGLFERGPYQRWQLRSPRTL